MSNPGGRRLFVMLAREAPVGVILARGPTRWTQLIHWDVARDVFTDGQWLHARVYENRCDLSPDGTKLVYFAADWRTVPDLEAQERARARGRWNNGWPVA